MFGSSLSHNVHQRIDTSVGSISAGNIYDIIVVVGYSSSNIV